jgi:pantoate--beta-alanine ligase
MYPEGLISGTYDFEGIELRMEGRFRKGHFDGVATVVEKLLTIVAPDKAYFGEKDFQQLQIIRHLVRKRNLPTEITGCPIVRELSGLAMSSRNERLTTEGRKEAANIYSTLLKAREKFGKESASAVIGWVTQHFHEHPTLRLEYFEIVNEEDLIPVQRKRKGVSYRAFIALYVEGIRLIDNMPL